MPRARDSAAIEAFGKAVEIARRRLGLSQAELAARCLPPMQPSRLGDVERGKAEPGLSLIVRLAQALGMTEAGLMEAMREERRHRAPAAAGTSDTK